MKKALIILILTLFFLATGGNVFCEEMAKEGTTTGKNFISGTSTVLPMGEERLQINYEGSGVSINDSGKGFLHNSAVYCVGSIQAVKGVFEELDGWIRRKLRCILWRQWKRHRTQFKELCRRGLDHERARRSAWNGRGPWWNAGASHMNHAVPTSALRGLGLLSLMDEHRRLASCS